MTAAPAGAGAAVAWPRPSVSALFPILAFKVPRLSRRRSVAVPLCRRLPRLLGTGLTLAFFGAVAITGCVIGGQYQAFREEYGEPHHVLARTIGLGIERVTISGIDQMREAEVLGAGGITSKVSLAFLNVAETRERLKREPLIQSASVRKLYPNELMITLTERQPHALWQHDGELFVIAADGTVIDKMRDDRFASLPLVVGDQANARTKDYLALLDVAGPLKPRIRAGTLVSGRRWTLKMQNGIDVRLPELGAAEAMTRLVKLDREQKLLDKDVIAIDLRMRDRVVVRMTEEAATARAELMKKKPTRGKGVET
jgi:cell division protein FtsQ